MGKSFSPRLAASVKVKKGEDYYAKLMEYVKNELRFPLLASPKLDGIRCIVDQGIAKSRKFIPIPNRHIQALVGQQALQGIDAEIIVGAPNLPGETYAASFSGAMKEEGHPDFKLYAFDMVPELAGFDPRGYNGRHDMLLKWFEQHKESYGHLVTLVPQFVFHDLESLLTYEDKLVTDGYEGVITAAPDGHYKYGRATLKDQLLFKLVRKMTEEFKIVGFKEQMHNGNEAKEDNFGHTKRSSHQENKTGKGLLGSFIMEIPEGHPLFKAGTFDCNGKMDIPTRKKYFENPKLFMEQFGKVEHRPYGIKDAPRFPVFLGLRSEMDMGDSDGESSD